MTKQRIGKTLDIKVILKILKKKYPQARCDLSCNSAWELLVSTMLSAQATDKSVVAVTPGLFKKYPHLDNFAALLPSKLEKDIRKIGLSKSKSKNIVATAKILKNNFNSEVPNNLESLVELPGVGRKTANVVLGNYFQIPSIAVDTHVKRISYRIGLSNEKDPIKIETDLQKIVPQKDWTIFAHLIIRHGRNICIARNPKCDQCQISIYCKKRI